MQGASTSRDEPMAAVSKFTLRGLIACALVLLATPALAASQKAHDDCNAEDPDRNIAGCTRIIADRGESKRVRGIAHVGRGLAWINKGELDRAIADFTQAIRLNPKDALAYSNRGLTWADKGDFDRAIVDYTTAIRLAPLPRSDLPGIPHVNIHHNRGIAWAKKGDLDRALADYDEAIRLDPGFAFAYYTRGVVWYEKYMHASEWIDKNDLNRAIADFSEAIRLDRSNTAYRRARAQAWQVNGDQERAIVDLAEVDRLLQNTPLPKLKLLKQ
jgi:tetratricopeptide (TPR) repeat protein